MKLKVITGIVLVLAVTFFSLELPSVSAPAIIFLPTYVSTPSNETFVLPFKMRFDEPDSGFFGIIFFWDVNETDPAGKYWNFTYEGFAAKFTDGTGFTATVVATIMKGPALGLPGVYRYAVTIDESDGEIKNGDFWVNATIRAAGLMNGIYTPHAIGDQNITIHVFVYETWIGAEAVCTVHVTAPPRAHDVALVNLTPSKTIVGQGYSTSINVTAENQGNYTETFNVTVYYRNSTYTGTVGTQTVTSLAAGDKKLLVFIWATDGSVKRCQPYTIIANASIVSGETDTADNSLVDGTIKVTIPGDLDGDGEVYTKDLGMLGKSWRKSRGQLGYIPEADIDCDGTVYIKDLGTVGKNWRKTA